MQVSFNTAGEKAWGIGANVDFAPHRRTGPHGGRRLRRRPRPHRLHDRQRRSPDRNETDVRVDYAFAKGSVLDGLRATFRYSWLHQDGAPQTGTQLRAYVNYAVKF